MSEVTAKDLREDILEVHEYWITRDRLAGRNPQIKEKERDEVLAAFDAMAEKAELFDKLDYAVNTYGREYHLSRGCVQEPAGRSYSSLAEALKAVPE